MTRRSAERWNTGKRGASQRKAERLGEQWISHNSDIPRDLAMEIVTDYEDDRRFRVRNLANAYRRGIRKWFESQPVEF